MTHWTEIKKYVKEGYWFAVLRDREDNDWGNGSYDFEEATQMLKDVNEGEGFIAVIDDQLCVDEIDQENAIIICNDLQEFA